MWSLCNEALCDGFDAATAAVLKPIGAPRALDPLGQRPVTAAMNGGFDGSSGAPRRDGHQLPHPELRPRRSTTRTRRSRSSVETSSDVSDRGVYANDVKEAYVSAYDVNKPGWGNTAEDAACAIESRGFGRRRLLLDGLRLQGRADAVRVAEHQLALRRDRHRRLRRRTTTTTTARSSSWRRRADRPHPPASVNWDATPCAGMCAPAAGGAAAAQDGLGVGVHKPRMWSSLPQRRVARPPGDHAVPSPRVGRAVRAGQPHRPRLPQRHRRAARHRRRRHRQARRPAFFRSLGGRRRGRRSPPTASTPPS